MRIKHSATKKFGDNLRRIRLEANLTQEQLAELSSCHHNYIGAVERGERNITVIKAIDIANALKCQISELFEGIQ